MQFLNNSYFCKQLLMLRSCTAL